MFPLVIVPVAACLPGLQPHVPEPKQQVLAVSSAVMNQSPPSPCPNPLGQSSPASSAFNLHLGLGPCLLSLPACWATACSSSRLPAQLVRVRGMLSLCGPLRWRSATWRRGKQRGRMSGNFWPWRPVSGWPSMFQRDTHSRSFGRRPIRQWLDH